MSYECWRREVELGRMAEWDEDRNDYADAPLTAREHLAWIRTQMPCVVTFHVGSSDDGWVRDLVTGGQRAACPRLQRVIVQGTDEQDRLIAKLANLKVRKGLPYDGATAERWQP